MVLFPYKSSHSPYCGITGVRLFPRKESIRADSAGNKDFMGIVVSKQPLDYNAVNTAISKSTQPGFAAKLNEVVSSAAIKNVQYMAGAGGTVYFKAGAGDQNKVVACIVEIDKQ
jgi:hypothetical protein